MIIKKVEIENIRSYEKLSLDFPLGSSILSGDIGSGKTSILLAIEFALFGLGPGQKGSSLLRHDSKQGKVILEVEIDEKNIILERGLKRGKTVSQEGASITIDGVKQELAVTELKNRVLSLLNYPQEFAKKTNLLYKFTVYTPQEEMKQIILEAAETRLNTLRHVFGIDKYKKVKENITLIASKLRAETRGYEGQIVDLENKKNKVKENIKKADELKLNSVILEKKLSEKIRLRERTEKDIKEIEGKIDEKRKYEQEIEKTQIAITTKKDTNLGMENEIKQIRNQIKESKDLKFSEDEEKRLKEEKTENLRKLEKINSDYLAVLSKISSINMKSKELEEQKDQISGLKHCPTCLQDVSDIYKANIVNKVETQVNENSKKLLELGETKNSLVKLVEQLKSKENEIGDRISELRVVKLKVENIEEKKKHLERISSGIEKNKQDIDMLEKQIEILKRSSFELSKFQNLYQTKSKELQGQKQYEKELEIKIAELKREIEILQIENTNIEKEVEEKEKIKKKLLYISEFEDWLSNNFLSLISFTEKNVMLKLREEFSKLFNEWFNVLVPDIFSVRLNEDFTPVIEQQDYELDYSFLSGGERTAIALAYRLALNQVINSLLSKIKTKNLVILDEPTDGFSEQQLDKMRDVLYQLSADQLILVSHEPKIESFVENIVKFKKEGNVSKIEIS